MQNSNGTLCVIAILLLQTLGLVTQRRLAINLKIRSKLIPFFFAIFEDSDLPPIIGSEIREQYPGSFMDFNLIDEETVYVTTLKILNSRAARKRFNSIIFCSHLRFIKI